MSPAHAAKSMLSTIHTYTTVAPLMAAVLAPFSVLFDIPALTEPWFIRTDPNVQLDPNSANSAPDPRANIALSAVGLGFNIVANALLIVRFSTSAQWWRVATRASLFFWVFKVIIALVNLCVFGPLDPDTRRGEGLWCAVVSLILCGLITFLLICHWGFEFNSNNHDEGPTEDQLAVRIAGRHFMLNVTLFVVDLGLLALLASRVEHWTYLQGMYFANITYLTIGFGDFYPTHTVTRILLFVFALVGVAQLGNIVSMLVGFFGSRAAEKRAAASAEFERRRQQEEEHRPGMTPDLMREIEFLHQLSEREEAYTRMRQLLQSLMGLVVFWIVGAAIFSQLEGWAYGAGLYFCYIVFLTVGYGDFAPVTPAGRVVFVLYSIIAVPIMASFAVQAVQQIFSGLSARQYDKTKAKQGLEPDTRQRDTEKNSRHSHRQQNHVIPHADLAEKWHHEWEEQVRRHKAEGFGEEDAQKLADKDTDVKKKETEDVDDEAEKQQAEQFDEDAALTERVLELALSLERRARKLLIMHLDSGDNGRTAKIVLKADRNVQLREVRALSKEIKKKQAEKAEARGQGGSEGGFEGDRGAALLKAILHDDPDEISYSAPQDEREVLDEIRRYRQDFAGLLAAGASLLGLKGDERALFERRRLKDRKQKLEERSG